MWPLTCVFCWSHLGPSWGERRIWVRRGPGDGGARPPSGRDMGIGISAKTFTVSRHVGQGTSNTAEFIALETAIDEARSRAITDELVIYTDSKLVYHQIRGEWTVKSETSKHYVPRIRKKMDGVTLVWIPRSKNKEADHLVTKAPDLKLA